MGVVKLAAAVGEFEENDWKERDLAYALFKALSACWTHIPDDVRSKGSLRDAFELLLNLLCARLVPEALHLRTQVAE